MVVPMAPKRKQASHDAAASDLKARIFLGVACFWPFLILALFAASAPRVETEQSLAALSSDAKQLKSSLRNVLDRVDVLGYGPTHPRVAVVVVGDDTNQLLKTVENVFLHTDMNRIFVVCVVVEGAAESPQLVNQFRKIDQGSTPHWHGLRPDIHSEEHANKKEDLDDDPHGYKMKLFFHPEKQGLAESRSEAVQFVSILNKHHENAGLKSPNEDIILLLLQQGVQIESTKWIAPVTSALIVPPPLLGEADAEVAIKMANAVAFNTEGPGRRTSFDTTFTPLLSSPSTEELNASNGDSYPAPAFSGAAIAMRLDTFVNLPSHDTSLTEEWPANLELTLNLWLCGDGIDVLKDVKATTASQVMSAALPPQSAARFAAAWMDGATQKRFFHAYRISYPELTYLEWETLMGKAKQAATFTKDLPKKCRSFKWFAETINPDIRAILAESEDAESEERSMKEEDDEREEEEQDLSDAKSVDEKAAGKEASMNDKGDDEFSIPERKDDGKKPSEPLCPKCLEIVQKAKPIDISFVDVSNGHKEHPHKGATDEHGKLGYIHDETALRKNPPALNYPEASLREACLKRDNNYKMLNERVYVDLEYDKKMQASGKPRPKIFCFVYTIDSGHSKIPNIRETWGPKCDGFMVASNLTDPTIGAVNIVHDGPETYNNIWQKVRSMWSYIYDNYYTSYDFFHIGGDDLMLIVENLRYYLESEEIQTAQNGGIFLPDGTETTQVPLFLGRRFAYLGDQNDIFNSGGSGYTLNKAALKTLVVNGFPEYFPHAVTFSEDTMVARVYRHFGVYPYETKDKDGGERYMPFLPGHHYGYRIPKNTNEDWYAKYSIDIKEGPEHCSPRSIAFHYVKDNGMKRLFALLYHLCPPDTLDPPASKS
ncbi:hypothetical protein MPSEU_001060600 [Mayamaea pseudoterrestris]|nr:hypothetical protein MPSEU_001060600 [Mayamaea pseudoterrestris]